MVKWFRHKAPNQWNRWAHQLYLEGDELEKFREIQKPHGKMAGVLTKLQKDEDGYFFNASRPSVKEYKGRMVNFNPPLVFEKDGKTPFEGEVGNGSNVTSKFMVYPYAIPIEKKMGSAIRWESSRINILVIFKRETDLTEAEEEKVREWEKHPIPQLQAF